MEKSLKRLTEELHQAKSATEDRQAQILELDTQRRIFEERLELKDKEMQQYIDGKEEVL